MYLESDTILHVVVGGAVTSCAGISAAFVCTVSFKQIYPMSFQSDFPAGEVSNPGLSPGFFIQVFVCPLLTFFMLLLDLICFVQFVLVFFHLVCIHVLPAMTVSFSDGI